MGDPVAFIVAETLDQAKDAAELLAIEYEILPAVTTAEAALASDAPAVWPRTRAMRRSSTKPGISRRSKQPSLGPSALSGAKP